MSRKNWSSDKIFMRLLNNKTTKTYYANIQELRKRPTQEVFERALQLGGSKIEKEKIIGIDVLAQFGFSPRYNQAKVIEFYFEILNAPQTAKVLSSVLSGIGHNNSILKNKHISKLAEFKNHRYSDVRYFLVHALSGVNYKSAVKVLIELSSDRHPQIRDWATFSIGSMIEMNTPEILEALKARLDDSDDQTREEAVAGLAQRKDSAIREILIEELKDADNRSSLVLESIELLGDKSFIPLLEDQIKRNKISKKVEEDWLRKSITILKEQAE